VNSLDPDVLDRLRDALGSDRVETSSDAREAYARDLSTLGHLAFQAGRPELSGFQPPAVVVRPADVAGVQAVLRLANELGFPVVPWGAGSGVCGGSVAQRPGVVMLDLKGLARLRRLDAISGLVEVEAGVNGQLFEDTLQRKGWTMGHFPSSITCSTVGGWVAARGAGQLSTRYGKVEDMVVSLEVVLPDGTLARTPVCPRAATGPDWNQVFTGCEGTLGIITACTLRMTRLPEERRFQSYSFPDLRAACNAIREGLQRGARPAAVRLYDPLDTLLVARAGDARPFSVEPVSEPADAGDPSPLGAVWPFSALSLGRVADVFREVIPRAGELGQELAHELGQRGQMALLARPDLANRLTETIPGVGCLLILSFEGEPELVAAESAIMGRACLAEGGVSKGPESAETWWRNRIAVSFKQSGVYAQGAFVDTMEVATSWDRLEELHARVRAAVSPHALVMAHFSHAYPDGCSIYFTFAAARDDDDPEGTIARYRAAWRDGLAAVVESGAAVSHHHGVGSLKGDALRTSHGPLHNVLRLVKGALDPNNVMNPGKLGLD
jgi:alkyldihydroxyacetonephosphate synthase